MRYATALRRLRVIAEECDEISRLWDHPPALVAAYAFGAVLKHPADLPLVQLALVLDLPVEDLAWCTQPVPAARLASLLALEKAPVDWYWRPTGLPVANHLIHRPLRIWTHVGGVDGTALDALARRAAEPLRLPPPDPRQEAEQLRAELAASLAHLRRLEAAYWERDWRVAHRGSGVHPENHLWDAVHGYFDLVDAVRARQPWSKATPPNS